MKRLKTRTILPALTALIGLVWVIVGLTKYGWWVEGRPQSGFFPAIIGGLLLFVSILAVMSEMKENPPQFLITHLYPILAAVGMVLAALLIGFFPALILYVFGWLKWYEKYNLFTAGLTTGITTALMYGVFYVWLRVPFPTGILVELL
ncbi:MAG: tripartite tricarboxylate transporter TctB family protein [Spirochaetaceae bacterium]|nr:tripartite tricarboxylate transporter TctB family protein [Spirochaetaceae bacterium]MCF7947596.1 tripartite tricarboxylate transporter TctB family protein [Spirochaetia bacterium]MCF7951464.1 tripartite tricarboxylate transporter TctB family protein [Spirochaetaceae bacterium]